MPASYGAGFGRFGSLRCVAAVPVMCLALAWFYVWLAGRLITLVSRAAKDGLKKTSRIC